MKPAPLLTCAHGLPWIDHVETGPCLWCVAASTEAREQFDAAVQRGEFTADGHAVKHKKKSTRPSLIDSVDSSLDRVDQKG